MGLGTSLLQRELFISMSNTLYTRETHKGVSNLHALSDES